MIMTKLKRIKTINTEITGFDLCNETKNQILAFIIADSIPSMFWYFYYNYLDHEGNERGGNFKFRLAQAGQSAECLGGSMIRSINGAALVQSCAYYCAVSIHRCQIFCFDSNTSVCNLFWMVSHFSGNSLNTLWYNIYPLNTPYEATDAVLAFSDISDKL